MSRQVHIEPAHNNRHGRVGAHAGQKQRGVLHLQVIMHRKQDGKARDGDADRANNKQEAVLGPVRKNSHDHGKPKRHDPGRDGAQLGGDGVVLVALDDGGREVGVRVGRDDQAEIHEAAEPDLVVGHDGQDVLELDLALGAALALRRPQPRLDVLALVVAEPFLCACQPFVFLPNPTDLVFNVPPVPGTRGR